MKREPKLLRNIDKAALLFILIMTVFIFGARRGYSQEIIAGITAVNYENSEGLFATTIAHNVGLGYSLKSPPVFTVAGFPSKLVASFDVQGYFNRHLSPAFVPSAEVQVDNLIFLGYGISRSMKTIYTYFSGGGRVGNKLTLSFRLNNFNPYVKGEFVAPSRDGQELRSKRTLTFNLKWKLN